MCHSIFSHHTPSTIALKTRNTNSSCKQNLQGVIQVKTVNRRNLSKIVKYKCKISAKLQTKEVQSAHIQITKTESQNLNNLPLPPTKNALPIFGHSLYFLNFPKLLKFLSDCRKDFGDIFSMKTDLIFGRSTVYIYDIDSILYLLGQEHNLVGPGYSKDFLKMMGSQNILVLAGKEHQQNRKILTKAFSNEAVFNYYLPVIVKIIKQRCLKWSGTSEAVDLSKEGKNLIFELAISIVLGKEFPEKQILECASLFSIMVDGFMVFDYSGSKLSKAFPARNQLVKYLQSNLKEIICEFQEGSDKKSWINIYMNNLIGSGQNLDIEQLSETTFAVLFAAYTTTSSSLLLLNYWITTHPQILQQLQIEQSQIIEEFGPEINGNTLQKMTFADKVIKEVLRVSPVVPVIPRVALKDFEINGFKIPKGWGVQLCPGRVVIEDWKDRWNEFDPSRWEEVVRTPKEYIPFGAGPRLCVGMQLALTQLKVYLALTGREYNIEQIDTQELQPGSLSVFQEGLFIKYSKKQ